MGDQPAFYVEITMSGVIHTSLQAYNYLQYLCNTTTTTVIVHVL